jgi:hypothetical protein
MTLTGPDRDEVFQYDPGEPELMKAMILAGVQVQIPVFADNGTDESKGAICKKPSTRARFNSNPGNRKDPNEERWH